jgi:hypothetical protein
MVTRQPYVFADVNSVPNLQGGTWFARLHFLTMLNFVSGLSVHFV